VLSFRENVVKRRETRTALTEETAESWGFPRHRRTQRFGQGDRGKTPEIREGCQQTREGCQQFREVCPKIREGCQQIREGCQQIREGCQQMLLLGVTESFLMSNFDKIYCRHLIIFVKDTLICIEMVEFRNLCNYTISVADPGCLSRIRLLSILDPNFFHPWSRICIKEFRYFNPKKKSFLKL
jgi:hypothetical protein